MGGQVRRAIDIGGARHGQPEAQVIGKLIPGGMPP